jgi:hypothetical protein
VHDTESVIETFDVADIRGEAFGRPLVANEQTALVREQCALRAQHIHRVSHVVQRLEDRDQLITPREFRVGGVPMMEGNAILDAALPKDFASAVYRCPVKVDPINVDLGVRTRDCET